MARGRLLLLGLLGGFPIAIEGIIAVSLVFVSLFSFVTRSLLLLCFEGPGPLVGFLAALSSPVESFVS